MRRAVRAVFIPAAVSLALGALLPAGAGAGSDQAPAIVLVSPANGALIQRSHVTFVWRVEWPNPPAAGTVQVVHRHAADRAFTREVVTTTRRCPAADTNCWTSFRPKATFYGRYYWQVSLTGAVQASSRTHLVTVSGPRDEIDRARPTVRALGGAGRRGSFAIFAARVRDNSGEVRLDAVLTRRSLPVVEGKTDFAPAVWGAGRRVRSSKRLSRTLEPGRYALCVTAWDRAGNRSRSCSRYLVR